MITPCGITVIVNIIRSCRDAPWCVRQPRQCVIFGRTKVRPYMMASVRWLLARHIAVPTIVFAKHPNAHDAKKMCHADK